LWDPATVHNSAFWKEGAIKSLSINALRFVPAICDGTISAKTKRLGTPSPGTCNIVSAVCKHYWFWCVQIATSLIISPPVQYKENTSSVGKVRL